jgi:hypothetical protein
MVVHTMVGVRSRLDQPWHELGLRIETLAQLPENLCRAAKQGVGLTQSRFGPSKSSVYPASVNAASPAI